MAQDRSRRPATAFIPAGSQPRLAAFLSYGFRPFFLGAAALAALSLPIWLLAYAGLVTLPVSLPAGLWHGHEMLFGYAAAVLAGFLLTATPSWSGGQPVRGTALALLAGVWLAGRIGVWAGGSFPVAAAAVDLVFLPALAVAIAPALQSAAHRNLVFLPILAALFLANLAVHLEALGLVASVGGIALRGAVDVFALLIALVGGRVVPAFTGNALRATGAGVELRPFGIIDRAAILSLVALLLADAAALPQVAGALALVAAILNALRMRGWGASHVLDRPILWVLHLGYAWLVAGLLWKGLVDLLAFAPPAEALHGLAVGAVGTMTLAIMSRATLGHTGRALEASPGVTRSFLLVSAAALVRMAAPLIPAEMYLSALALSGVLWSLAFLLFLIVYTPMLLAPRASG